MPTCRRDRVHRPPVLQKSYPVTDARCAPLRRVRSAMVCPTRRCGTGGYKIRPYRPASGFPVGAAYMAARNRVLIRAVVRRFSCRRGAHGASACPRRARQSADRCGRRAACPHAAAAGCIDRQPYVSRTRLRTRDARPCDGCVQRRCVRRGGAARAAIQAAPTDPLAGGLRGGAGPQFRSGTTVERTTWVWVVPKCCIRATS